MECDGATYHSARSARDRDRLRQDILERLGWRIHRIWSTDWYRNREASIAALRRRIEEVLRESVERARRDAITRESEVDESEVVGRSAVRVQTMPQEPLLTKDEAKRLLHTLREQIMRDFPNSDRSKGLLRRGLVEILLDELPTNTEEWNACVPDEERQDIDHRHLRYLEGVFRILRRVPPQSRRG